MRRKRNDVGSHMVECALEREVQNKLKRSVKYT
jgi:hypothetical protein